jgi:drug/metabolite transporter (DMT)-like permease
MKQLHYSLFVLLGACSYGIHASIVKIGFAQGYNVTEVTGIQYLYGVLILLIAFLFSKKVKLNGKQIASLFGVGILLSLTGIFYGASLARVPASIAVVMLFQFTWIGLLIEAVYLKKIPSNKKLLSVVFLWAGTLLAGGIGSQSGFSWSENIEGILLGFLGSITFALFIFFSGKVAKGVPSLQRSLFIGVGGLLTVFLFFQPSFLTEPIEIVNMLGFGLLVALFGMIFPIVLFAIGTPHLDSSISTIVGAAELPAAIIAAVIILDENISLLQIMGILLILIGIVIPQIHFRTHHPRKQYG